MANQSIFPPLGIFYGHLVYFPRFGLSHQEKYGNPAPKRMFYVKVAGAEERTQELICFLFMFKNRISLWLNDSQWKISLKRHQT
jgi:hypothetical protein